MIDEGGALQVGSRAEATASPPSHEVAKRMKQQRRRDTAPELLLQRELWRKGLRYRVDHKVLGTRRRVDIVFTRRRVAVFVDGCFWHACPEHGTVPKNNREWWATKLRANVARDRDSDRSLQEAGWAVVRVWEHEDMQAAADRIDVIVRSPGSGHRPGVIDVADDVVQEVGAKAK